MITAHDSVIEVSSFGVLNKLGRIIWYFVYWIFFRPFFPKIFRKWRCSVLRILGADIGTNTNVAASVKIWAPWNLVVGSHSSIGPHIDLYNQGKITIGNHTIISQKTYLCASSHDYRLYSFPLIKKPILIEDRVWIAADAFIGPGARIGKGAVVAARAVVFGSVTSWTVVGGNPAQPLKTRVMETISHHRFP